MSQDYTVNIQQANVNSAAGLDRLGHAMTDLMNEGFEIERTILRDGLLVVIMVRLRRQMPPEEIKRMFDKVAMFNGDQK